MRKGILAEYIGVAALLTSVIGSGIMATNLTQDVGLQLIINAISIVAMLGIIIYLIGPISGAHFARDVKRALLQSNFFESCHRIYRRAILGGLKWYCNCKYYVFETNLLRFSPYPIRKWGTSWRSDFHGWPAWNHPDFAKSKKDKSGSCCNLCLDCDRLFLHLLFHLC